MINISSSNLFIDLSSTIIFSIIFALVTVIFCFWCIYILDAIRRKWKFYRNSSNRLLERDGDSQEEILAYNAKTEFVKYVFLFFINLLEWATVAFMVTYFIINRIVEYHSHSFNETYVESGISSQVNELQRSTYELKQIKHILDSLPFFHWATSCIILSLVLIASLCMYLAARQARLSWMKSNKIPYLIAFFLISLILTQTISTIYSTILLLICDLCYSLVLTLALLFLAKQYRKLLMVINWSIVDLQISGNTHLLQKQIQMKRRFVRIFKLLFISYIFVLPFMVLGPVARIGLMLFEQRKSSKIIKFYNDAYGAFCLMAIIMGLISSMVMFIPYIGFGLSTMCAISWRLMNGKTGYKTHYKNPMNPII